MGAPPPYGPKKSNTTTIVFVVLGVCAACCILGAVGVVGAGIWGVRKSSPTIACALGFEEVARAMKAYTDEHGGKFPKADKWQDELRPYFVKQLALDEDDGAKMFGTFDPDGVWSCKEDSSGGTMTGIAFNTELSGKNVKDIQNKRTTYILFEVPKTGMNLHDTYTQLSETSSPRIFGQPRGWFYVDADFEVDSTSGDTDINFGTRNRSRRSRSSD
jgi:hypothetical protein